MLFENFFLKTDHYDLNERVYSSLENYKVARVGVSRAEREYLSPNRPPKPSRASPRHDKLIGIGVYPLSKQALRMDRSKDNA